MSIVSQDSTFLKGRFELTCDHIGVAILASVVRQVGRLRRKILLSAERLRHLELVGETEVAFGVHADHALDVQVGRDGGAGLPAAAAAAAAVAAPGRGHGRLGVPVGHDAGRRCRGRRLVEVVVRLVEVFPVE